MIMGRSSPMRSNDITFFSLADREAMLAVVIRNRKGSFAGSDMLPQLMDRSLKLQFATSMQYATL